MSNTSSEAYSQEPDFEDIVAQFERNISSSQEDEAPLERRVSRDEEEDGCNVIIDVARLESDLQVLYEALMEHLQSNSSIGTSGLHDNTETTQGHLDSGVTREVFRAEIKATLTQMKNFRESDVEAGEMLSSAERSTIKSLKRQVRERDQQLKEIKQELKEAQIVKHRLQDSVKGHQIILKEFEDANELLENEVSELRKQNAALTKRCSDADVRHRKDHYERDRMSATLTQFRRELLIAHQKALSARTEAKQAKKRTELLEARAAEEAASSAAVSLRIKELKEIQEQMVAIMRGVQESGDITTTRHVLAQLAEQRSRMVGRIANLLTRKKKRGENSQRDENLSHTFNGSETSAGKTSATPNNSSSPVNNSSSPSAGSHTQNSDIDGLNRKQRLENLRRFGSDLTRMTTGRRSRRVVMKNVEKTCEAVEQDTEALREVIAMKQSELDRMEEELADAIDRAETFEIALQKERQKKKLENRNMKNTIMDTAMAEMRSFTTTRRKKSTLFEWQSQNDKKEGNEASSGAETTISTGVTTRHSKFW